MDDWSENGDDDERGLLSDDDLAEFDQQNALLLDAKEELLSIGEFLACRLDDARAERDALRAKLDALRTWAMSHEDFLVDDDNCSVERWDEFRAAVKASREDVQ